MIKKIVSYCYNNVQKIINWLSYNIIPTSRPKYNKHYNIAICAIFKNEARFLKEWIDYHELIGVEHFYLYNNNSTDNYKDILEDYIASNRVTLISWPYQQGQISAYRHFYDNYWQDSQWVSFLDIDEFFVPKKEFDLLSWIKKRDKYPVHLVYWKIFGSNGILNHDDQKLCIEQYTNSWENPVRCGKCIINTDYEISQFNGSVHHRTVVTKAGRKNLKLYPMNPIGKIVVQEKESLIEKKESDNHDIQINHYWSKGWDVFNQKRSWTGDVFFQLNPKNNIYYFIKNEILNTGCDLSIHRFLLLLKWKMNNLKEYQEMVDNRYSNPFIK